MFVGSSCWVESIAESKLGKFSRKLVNFRHRIILGRFLILRDGNFCNGRLRRYHSPIYIWTSLVYGNYGSRSRDIFLCAWRFGIVDRWAQSVEQRSWGEATANRSTRQVISNRSRSIRQTNPLFRVESRSPRAGYIRRHCLFIDNTPSKLKDPTCSVHQQRCDCNDSFFVGKERLILFEVSWVPQAYALRLRCKYLGKRPKGDGSLF